MTLNSSVLTANSLPPSQPVIIHREQIFKIYGSGETEVRALNDINPSC